jgi:hypothetical protein
MARPRRYDGRTFLRLVGLERLEKMKLGRKEVQTDVGAGERQESVVDLGQAISASAEATLLMQPRQGLLDDPAMLSQAAAARRAPSGQHGLDASLAQGASMWLRVIGPISLQSLGPYVADGLACRAPEESDRPRGSVGACPEFCVSRFFG